MKEENKKKLKRFCKVFAYVGGLFAMLLLGMGLGNCSAKVASSKGEAVSEATLRDQRTLSHKRALDPAEYRTLADVKDNLLFDAEAGHYFFRPETLDDVSGYRVASSISRDLYLIRLDVGSYIFDFSASSNDWIGDMFILNDYGGEQVHKRLNGEPSERVFVETADVGYQSGIVNAVASPRRVVSVDSSHQWLCLYLGNLESWSVSVSLYDPLDAPASHVITFPDDYNPLSGFGIPNDGLVGQLSGNRTSPFRLDLYFRSGGKVFKRIDFYFLPMQGMEYVSTLSSSGTPSVFSGSGFVYCSVIEYISLDGTSFTAWRAIFGTKADGNVYLRNFGEWTSNQYKTIDVFLYTPVYGQSGVAPNLDQVGILELRTASGVPTPIIGGDSNADVFSLLGVGFQSVAGLLNIQILPFLTLGTLLFVPLVVIIIFAILKVLNK